MKVLLINKYYYLRGGSERYFFDLKNLLENNGHTVMPFSMKHEKNENSEYWKYFADEVEFKTSHSLSLLRRGINGFKIFYNRDAVQKLEKLIRDKKPDIAHLHNIAHQLSPGIISVLKKHNIPIVQTAHDYKLICPAYLLFNGNNECRACSGGKYYNCFFKKCVKKSWLKSFIAMCEAYLHNQILKTYGKVDLFIAPTGFVKDACVEAGVSGEKIRVVRGFIKGLAGCEEEKKGREGKDGEEGKEGRQKLEIGNWKLEINDNYILYFGRLSMEKGVYVLLDAMSKLDKKVKLKIVGDGPEKRNYELRIRNYELSSQVEIMGDRYGEELKKMIQEAAAVIVPSICPESMCYSLLEAMALGKIVIASRIGGMKEFIEDGKNGFLFKPGDSGELAEKINLLFCGKGSDPLMGFTPLDKADIANRARATAFEFSPDKHYAEIMRIYNRLS